MSVITVTFYDGETGEPVAAPSDFALLVYAPGSDQEQSVKPVAAPDGTFVAVLSPGIFTVYFGTVEKIASLDPETPGDIALLTLDGEDAHAYYEIYLWELKPDNTFDLPPNPGKLGVTCAYCDNRFNTVGSPYYMNRTWYLNCYNNPPCT